MRLPIAVLFLFTGLPSAMAAPSVMTGAQAMVTAEAQEGSDTLVGVNVVPLVVEYAATTSVGIRVNTIFNLEIEGSEYAAAARGLGVTLPLYLSATAPDGRTYVGPHLGFTRDPRSDSNNVTLGGEFGLRWPIAESVSLNLTVQAGMTRVLQPAGDEWDTLIGIYPGLGYWPAI
jgi:hypothetical protein